MAGIQSYELPEELGSGPAPAAADEVVVATPLADLPTAAPATGPVARSGRTGGGIFGRSNQPYEDPNSFLG